MRHLPVTLSSYRLHPGSKTVSQRPRFDAEWRRAREKTLGRPLTWRDDARWYYHTARVVWRFLAERGVWKLGYDRAKYLA